MNRHSMPSSAIIDVTIFAVTIFAVTLAGPTLAAATPAMVVPDIVHQTYDYRSPNFFMYLSFVCVQHYLKPKRHVLWVNDEGRHNKNLWESWKSKAAEGSWEAHLAKWLNTNVIETKFFTYPIHPPGNDTTWVSNKAHRSDFVRMHALSTLGGIYLDTDAFPIASLAELRVHNFTLSFDNIVNPDPLAPKRLNNGVLLSSPGAAFLRVWMGQYANFDPSSFEHHSSVLPYTLATKYPDLVHIEMSRISPISFGFQTHAAAAALTCGLYSPREGYIWYPTYDPKTKKYTFANTSPDHELYRALSSKLVLHLTMSQVRGICMMRKTLGSGQDLLKMPSFLGAVFRRALGEVGGAASPPSSGGDTFDYDKLLQAPDAVRDEAWSTCRNMLGMHSPPDPNDPSRQQYVSHGLPK